MERFLENAMYASRWLLAPVYFGLSLGLIALTIKFFQEIFHILPHIFSVSESDMILTLLSLVDMTLVGGLLVMVMFSGYENFVSQLDINEEMCIRDSPGGAPRRDAPERRYPATARAADGY